ncbi:MAG: response regulator [Anaerolineales bacterium]|nr:response regulator [Anaerolineales bacterium]
MNIPYGPILVVEDVPHVLELLEVTLRFKGYPIITARNGQEALELIAKEHPALIITDILMPKMDGFAMVHRLRSDPKTSDIPIIFLSATYITPEDKDFAMSLGAVRFLEKPVDTEEFLLTVAEVLTAGPAAVPDPISEQEFCRGYRKRLEIKLRHKINQIKRTERLLETLPEEQKPAFRTLLEEANMHRSEIQKELDELYNLLGQYPTEN